MSERSLQIPKTFGNPIPDATEHDSAVGVMPFPSFGNTLPGLSHSRFGTLGHPFRNSRTPCTKHSHPRYEGLVSSLRRTDVTRYEMSCP